MFRFNDRIYVLTLASCMWFCSQAVSQTAALDKSKYPFVVEDLAGDALSGDGLIRPGARIALPIPGAWGVSATGEFLKQDMLYVSAEAGYGMGLTTNKKYTKPARMWFSIDAGYPLFHFKKAKKGKWVVHQETVATGRKTSALVSEYFKVTVPNHHFIILQAGYARVPYSHNSNSLDNGTAGVSMLVVAPVYRVGIKHKAISSTLIRLRESGSGAVYSGRTLRVSEMYFGIVVPARDQVVGGPANFNELKKTAKYGVEMQFKIPMFMNGLASLDLGIRSIGYDNKGQLYIGNTFNIR